LIRPGIDLVLGTITKEPGHVRFEIMGSSRNQPSVLRTHGVSLALRSSLGIDSLL
jgi:hypothetical protein